MPEATQKAFRNFEENFEAFRKATPLMRPQCAEMLASQADLLSQTSKGLRHLYEHSLLLEREGFFENTAWEHPRKQVPALVKGTLMAGHPSSSFEILSELRILSYAAGKPGNGSISQAEAQRFLEEVIVHNLEFAFDELREESRLQLTQQERKKVVQHFSFIMEQVNLHGIKDKLAEEIRMVCDQRPIVTNSIRGLIQTIYHKMDLNPESPVDQRLQQFVNAVYQPGPMVNNRPNFTQYKKGLEIASKAALEKEAQSMGKYLQNTGLSNPYLALMLRFCLEEYPELIPDLLHLTPKGIAEWERYSEFATDLALSTFHEYNYRGIFGFKRMLEQNLFYRRAVRAGLTNLKLISIHPQVNERILQSEGVSKKNQATAKQYLIGALISILGQPIGIGQGNNPTCQSARGISMWAQHAPAKLINMITTVATANNLIMRFEDGDLESIKLQQGLLVNGLDSQLDAVSTILVPHIDKIYGEMMRLASGRGEDPHKWVNPALYGHWVPHSLASAYSYLANAIVDYDGFVRLFYASFHPDYNGGRQMVYPNPIGIFVTSSRGDMLGFHAVSLLRVSRKNPLEEVRCYFLNPNNEGRQNWGQGIRPSVSRNGEKYGESSLPIAQFVARAYAFHYNRLSVAELPQRIPKEEVAKISALAKESWGKVYQWADLPKRFA